MSIQACAELVRKGDPDRFLATMTGRPDQRARLFPIYAFNLEVARAPWLTQEPVIADMRLQWWRDALEEIGAGKTPRAHEVVGPLADVIRAQALPVDLFDQLIAARRWDIGTAPFEDDAEFVAQIERTAGHLMWLASLALGAPDRLEEAVRDVAFGGGVANWLAATAQLEARGRYPLPDGRPAAIRDLASAALDRLQRARATDFGAALPAVRAAWQAPKLLRLAMRHPARVAEGTLATSEFRRRASLLCKIAVGRW